MAIFKLTEKQKRSWAFVFIAGLWLLATGFIVWHLSPKVNADADARRIRLASYDQILEEQDALLQRQMEIYEELRAMKFDIYQTYRTYEMEEKIKALYQENSATATHSKRVSALLMMLLRAREHHVAKQRTIIQIDKDVQNCREGNLGSQPE